MQLALIIVIILIAIVGVAWAWKIGNPDFTKRAQYEKEGLEKLDKIISSVGKIEDIEFFTDGHPYVWVEVSYAKAQNIVRCSCSSPYPGGAGPIPATFETKIDTEKQYIYLIKPGMGKFKWPVLQHYNEWNKGNESYAKKIAANKNSK